MWFGDQPAYNMPGVAQWRELTVGVFSICTILNLPIGYGDN